MSDTTGHRWKPVGKGYRCLACGFEWRPYPNRRVGGWQSRQPDQMWQYHKPPVRLPDCARVPPDECERRRLASLADRRAGAERMRATVAEALRNVPQELKQTGQCDPTAFLLALRRWVEALPLPGDEPAKETP